MTSPADTVDPDAWHALDAPFTTWADWNPQPGTCSRCGHKAERGRSRWWHLGPVCPARGRTARFIPA